MAAIHIGISGWPHDTEQAAALARQHEPRLNGHASGYTPQVLQRWGDRIDAWYHGQQPADPQLIAPRQKTKTRRSREVFCYFDNDIKVRAPFDARRLLERFHLDKDLVTAPGEPVAEGVLP